jgi:hypothetical protein
VIALEHSSALLQVWVAAAGDPQHFATETVDRCCESS